MLIWVGSIRMYLKLIHCEVYGFIRLTVIHPEEGRYTSGSTAGMYLFEG
jgi:hypothetical protein